MSPSTLVRALVLSCHPIPSLAVTAITAGLAGLAGLSLSRAVLLTAAVLAGQLSIGWSNDYVDAERDRTVQRGDKPLASGQVNRHVAALAAVIALTLNLVMSAALGWPAGALAAATTGCGWLYNVALKKTVLSWLPYALAFGMLPAVATLSALPPRWPPAWACAAGALLGVAAHLANVLPDLGQDAETGIRGLPHLLGAKATALSGAGFLLAASAVILFGPGQPGPWRWYGFFAALLVAGAAAASAYRDPSSQRFFRATILIAALDLTFFALSGTGL
jgi:4-hydroxybenzoate polyprenyltransferase